MSKLRILNGAAPESGSLQTPRIENYQGKIGFVTLGCAKNQVDSEVMIGSLATAGFECVDDVTEADIAIVNTCGFLQAAVEESIDTILDISELKQKRLRKLIVAGCMVDRYGASIKETLPEVDHFLSSQDLLKVIESAKQGYDSPLESAARPYFIYDDTLPRYLESNTHSAFVKISEGCNRPCSFCIIPYIRGKFRSRTPDSVISEINKLHSVGIVEANLVAQDLTDYGTDLKDGTSIISLLKKIENEATIPWVRLFYAYPLGVSKELLSTIKESSRIVNYLDIPLQHVSDHILKSMKRPRGKYSPKTIANFLREIQFESVGIFEYSPEAGTPAAELPEQIEPEERKRRREYLMEVQQQILSEKLPKSIGRSLRVLIEGEHPESSELFYSRSTSNGPDVDSGVIINDIDQGLRDIPLSGRFGSVQITDIAGYDLVGTLVKLDEVVEQ